MDLLINIESAEKIVLTLQHGRVVVATSGFRFDRHLDTRAVVAIDNFIKENKMDALSIRSIRVNGSVDEDGLTRKILGTIAEAAASFAKVAK